MAVSAEDAFRILEDEARQGLLDGDIVSIFIESGIIDRVTRPAPPAAVPLRGVAGHGSHTSRREMSTR